MVVSLCMTLLPDLHVQSFFLGLRGSTVFRYRSFGHGESSFFERSRKMLVSKAISTRLWPECLNSETFWGAHCLFVCWGDTFLVPEARFAIASPPAGRQKSRLGRRLGFGMKEFGMKEVDLKEA